MNRFVELTEDDLMGVNGGVNWAAVAAGTGVVLGAAALAVSGGLAFIPVAVILELEHQVKLPLRI
ncbi:class IIb bacteriocin, lactobin A/cerein 7B family [Thermoanaerobacter sp. YS13]|uniref:Blp family class II bacteriocin n=1 Tax=Thermoanaerobacter sp. YS13 TaxID=1511746 RepID=UPI000575C213|nr:Blp family class II bacteriocin [Thermoanaerobacter sp. YS13]KHO62059.1 class IIb bacteriocin, lactobin A/cerein 7B family [Thermoanaerobacter sp. YS13]